MLAMALRCSCLSLVLLSSDFVCGTQAASLRNATKLVAQSAAPADKDAQKLQGIEHSLQALLKAHAPDGTKDLLQTIQKGETDLKAAGKSDKARAAVMKDVNAAMNNFKAAIQARQNSLKKQAAADDKVRARKLKPLALRLQSRLDKLNKLEQEARKQAKERAESGAKVRALKSKGKQTKEDAKSDAMLKHFAEKAERTLKKKLVKWAGMRKALTTAIKSVKAGDADGARTAMDDAMKIEKGQNFLY